MASRVEHFRALLERQPDNALFHFSLAQALIGENRSTEAIPHFERCVASRADWMMPRILLAKVYLQLGRHAEARPLLVDALHLAMTQQHDDPEREIRALLDGLPRA